MDGLTAFALVPMGTNGLRYNQRLEIQSKSGRNGLIMFQCIPMGNSALSYDQLELQPSYRDKLSSQFKAPL